MIGYRSVGESELFFMINKNNPIYGQIIKYNHDSECSKFDYGVVSFFDKPVRLRDSFHKYHISVNIPDDSFSGIGKYDESIDGYVAKYTSLSANNNGLYKISEHYTRCYWPGDIETLEVGEHCSDFIIEDTIIPFCKKNNIRLFKKGIEIKL